MKQILIPGDLERLENKKIFSCDRCGCVFEATLSDYKYECSQYNEDIYSSTCPTCGRRAYEKTQ